MKLLDKDGLTYYTGKIKNELTDYVKNTDYMTNSKGGVAKISNTFGTDIANGYLVSTTKNYNDYSSGTTAMIISKGTLENVITGKELVNKTYVDNIVGDIDTILTRLTTGSGV